MLLKPNRTKYTKSHKGRISFAIKQNQNLAFGNYGLVAIEPVRLKASQIAAAQLAIKRKLKREAKLWIRVFPQIPVTKKPAEVRMGKGKGAIDHWMCRIKSGTIMFEINCSNEALAKSVFEIASSKLPIKTRMIKRI